MSNPKIKGQRRGKAGTIVFFSIYFALIIAACIGIMYGLSVLRTLLSEYEDSQHYHVTDAIMAELNGGDLTKLFDSVDADISRYETIDALYDQIRERYSGTFSCAKSPKYSTEDTPVYVLKCDDENFAYMELKKGVKTPEFNIDTYEFSRVYGISAIQNEQTKVKLPSNCTFTVNGMSPDNEEFTTEEFTELSHFEHYISDAPDMRTYSFSGLMNQPEIKFFDKNGESLPDNYENGLHSCTLPLTDKTAAEEAADYAYEFAKKYNEYISYDVYFYDIKGYMLKDTTLYENLRTYMAQFASYHDSYRFENKEIVSMTQYTDDCYAIRLKYDHILRTYGRDITYPVDYTIYVSRVDNKWKIIDLILS